ncbi:MAG: hypothetical protein M3R38_18335 [Actinomycetota bacterium]|nr:hypothetical protein [Actinomycetota bacterium]
MLETMEETEKPGEGFADEVGPRRVYPPHEVRLRLEVSASGLRRLAGIYERSMGPLPRDERGRVWPEEVVEVLEQARAAVREQRAVSIEAALRGQETPQGGVEATAGPPATSSQEAPTDVGAAILEELRGLRRLVEEQNRRIGELEASVRGTSRELTWHPEDPQDPTPDAPGVATGGAEASGEGQGPPEPPTGSEGSQGRPRSWWRKLFGG